MGQGLFITFEGGEGCGKSTQARRLVDYLKQAGEKVVLTREPGGTRIGDQVREILLCPQNHRMEPVTELLLFGAARHQHTEEVIKPNLEKGIHVVCDRYADSSEVYQGYAHGLHSEIPQLINVLAIGCLRPDRTFLLDIGVKEGLKRKMSQGEWNRLDQMDLDFHCRLQEGYRQLAADNPRRIKMINAEGGIDEVWQEIRNSVDELWAVRKPEGGIRTGKEQW